MERNRKASGRGRGLWVKVLKQLQTLRKQLDKRPSPLKELKTWRT